ncbi:MAG: hypothetical protein IJ455_08510 [Agathobacter sp.]|nr:hypothetical protein [Agathobacter sp.]
MIKLFIRRVWKNKIYWLAVFSALVLLLCSVIYTDMMTGETFTYLSLFYNEDMQARLGYGAISLKDIFIGYNLNNYLWMFAPIIVGIPCVLNQRTERFVLFRGSKNGYFISKYVSNLILGGGILVLAHVIFILTGMGLVQYLTIVKQMDILPELFWDSYMAQRLWDIFCDGVLNAIPGILLAEFIRNKYLILCVPFVWNYLVDMFLMSWIPLEIRQVLLPEENPIVYAGVLLACGILIKVVAERRCDCGQK